jgi:transcription antitermination factor NusG
MNTSWYVLHTKPRKEEFLRDQLSLRRIEAYCPTIHVHRVNPRARKISPYFPGYVFIHVCLSEICLSTLQWIAGSLGLLTFGGEPARVPEVLIYGIQKRVNEINAAGGEFLDSVQPGETVLILEGPFAGHEAIFDARLPSSERVRVLLKLLSRQQVSLVLPTGQVQQKKPL